VPLSEDTGDFRLVDSAVLDAFNCLDGRNNSVRGLMCLLGFKQAPY
jgi:hypothetical protein